MPAGEIGFSSNIAWSSGEIADCGLRNAGRRDRALTQLIRNPQSAILLLPPAEDLHQPPNRIVVLIDHPLLERDDRVVGDRDVFRAYHCAALRYVAVADAVLFLQRWHAVGDVERMHLEGGDVNQESRADELVMQVVVAHDVTHVLAE